MRSPKRRPVSPMESLLSTDYNALVVRSRHVNLNRILVDLLVWVSESTKSPLPRHPNRLVDSDCQIGCFGRQFVNRKSFNVKLATMSTKNIRLAQFTCFMDEQNMLRNVHEMYTQIDWQFD